MLIKNWEFVLVFLFALLAIPIATVYIGIVGSIFAIICTLLMSYIAFLQHELKHSKN